MKANSISFRHSVGKESWFIKQSVVTQRVSTIKKHWKIVHFYIWHVFNIKFLTRNHKQQSENETFSFDALNAFCRFLFCLSCSMRTLTFSIWHQKTRQTIQWNRTEKGFFTKTTRQTEEAAQQTCWYRWFISLTFYLLVI